MAKQSCLLSFFNRSQSATPKKEVAKTIKLKGIEVSELSIVWGKLEGHPWWPGLVCLPPCGDSFCRKNAVHMQFFEDPPSRGWVRESFLKPYGDPMSVGVPSYKDQAWRTAKALADDAAKLPVAERRALLVTHELSDVEMQDDDEEEEEEELDAAEEDNSSKENIDKSNLSESTSPKANNKRAQKKADSDQPSKRRRIVLLSESDESADEYKPDKEEVSSDESVSSGVDEDEVSKDEPTPSDDEHTPSPSPVKKPKTAPKKKTPSASNSCSTPKGAPTPYTPSAPPFTPYTPTAPPYSPVAASASPSLKSKLSLFAAKESVEAASEAGYAKPSFLLPEHIKDAAGRRPDHPDYDPRTLQVPDSFLNQQTPCHRQWWKFKSQHFDTVLFFKMGKFYEFFYMDAEIGVQELGLILMKGTVPHSGFPEISYGRYSSSLIEKGYKVARIEQTETPDMMDKRCKATPKCSKFDKVVRREICQLSSAGTRVWGVQDAELTSAVPSYLLALTAQSKDGTTLIGVAFIDTSLGVFHLGQFSDDRHHSRLRTLLAHHPPAQLLTERNKLPSGVRQVLVQSGVPPNLHDCLTPTTEFWSAEKTVQFMAQQDCLKAATGATDWPEELRAFLTEDCTMAVEGRSDLSLSALGALLWYLQRCYLRDQLLSRRLFQAYTPPDLQQESLSAELSPKQRVIFRQRHMVIDGSSMENLEVLRNSSTGEVSGSLYALLDYTSTPMGKRLLQQWVSSPLMCCRSIRARQDAVLELRELGAAVENATALLAKLPDIERLLPRIHSQGLRLSSTDPNTRAVLFEEQQYSKKRVLSFLAVIQAFHSISKLPSLFNEVASELLRSLVTLTSDGGKLPAMADALLFFEGAFDHELARKEGKIIPSSGVDEQYDSAMEAIQHTKDEIDQNLKDECKFFGAKIVYFGSDRKRYQLEVPEVASKQATSEYELVSQRKGFKRFWTPRCKELLAQMSAAEQAREAALKDIARRIFHQFDDKQSLWSAGVECVATLDVLVSLTKYSLSVACAATPQVVDAVSPDETFVDIREGVHPCIVSSQDDIIPNDVVLGRGAGEGAHSPLVLVTGPNMGGKSTLMRQTALLTIMAQMGSLVPCSSMRLTPVDRIFTRVGASDRMLAGESTFLLELRETASILQHATPHALVLIDELGRGTATHDGTAVAWAVAGALVERGCRTLFSTHYHSLVHHFAHTPGVSMGHMACMVEEADAETGKEETITFLYKFCEGVCPKSYGFNAARLAEVPASVVQKGRAAARLMEGRSDAVVAIKTIFSDSGTLQDKRKVLKNLESVLEALDTSLA